jgi:hypothetical protein
MTDSPPARNLDLLERTMAHIEAHPEQHDQGSWINACGTTFCFAGHAALLAGASKPLSENGFGNGWFVDTVTSTSRALSSYWDVDEDGVREFARRSLGLSEDEADVLFNGGRDINELRAIVNALKDNASVIWSFVHGDQIQFPYDEPQDFGEWLEAQRA